MSFGKLAVQLLLEHTLISLETFWLIHRSRVTTGATVDGRVLALNGAVTLDTNTINTTDYDNIVLAPASATNPVGTDHTVTATVAGTGNPVPRLNVTFNVVSGPNVGLMSSSITDVNGQASFTYTSNGSPGTDYYYGQAS